MGNLVKFGNYFYDEDPEITIKNVVSRFLKTGYLSRRNIEDLDSIGISEYEFLNIHKDLEFLYKVKRAIYDDEKWEVFQMLLLDLEILLYDGTFEFSHKSLGATIKSKSSPSSYIRGPFSDFKIYDLDFISVLLTILRAKNSEKDDDRFDSSMGLKYIKNYSNNCKGNFPLRKTRWFDIQCVLELELNFGVSSILKNTNAFGYEPISNFRKKANNILENEVMFKFLKLNEFDKFKIESKSSYGYYSDMESFKIEIKRIEKSAEQSADFFI